MRCQSIFASLRSRHNSVRCFFSLIAVITKMCLPQTIGDACPLPGRVTFHTMFCIWLHLTGTFVSRLVPSPRGPRQPGQFSAKAASDRARMNGIAKHKKVIIFRLMILPTPTVNAYSALDECTVFIVAVRLLLCNQLFGVTNSSDKTIQTIHILLPTNLHFIKSLSVLKVQAPRRTCAPLPC